MLLCTRLSLLHREWWRLRSASETEALVSPGARTPATFRLAALLCSPRCAARGVNKERGLWGPSLSEDSGGPILLPCPASCRSI